MVDRYRPEVDTLEDRLDDLEKAIFEDPKLSLAKAILDDHLVRVADDAIMFQDRITGVLDAHLSTVSNRLNEVMKVLTVVPRFSCRSCF